MPSFPGLRSVNGVDFFYVGDDFKRHGNDYPGYLKVGAARAACLANRLHKYQMRVFRKFLASRLGDSSDVTDDESDAADDLSFSYESSPRSTRTLSGALTQPTDFERAIVIEGESEDGPKTEAMLLRTFIAHAKKRKDAGENPQPLFVGPYSEDTGEITRSEAVKHSVRAQLDLAEKQ